MSDVERPGNQAPSAPLEVPPVYFDARTELAGHFLFGEGLEIGALHQPLTVPAGVKVRYVDRRPVDELRRDFPELAEWDMKEADVLDDGELLSTIAEESQDFIIANHFLEHCEDPISTIRNHLGKLRPGGILFYAVPDKRYTFDFRRGSTSLEHVVADFEQGPQHSRRDHYDEWVRLVSVVAGETADDMTARARELEDAADTIHMHVWTQADFLRLILAIRERFDDAFDIEASARLQIEFIVVLRKRGNLPAPNPAATPDPVAPATVTFRRRVRAMAGRVVRRLRRTAR
jgi:SAM-dependent methyltransferase